jgi:hypothetical protein
MSAFRGLVNPLLDKRMEAEPKYADLVKYIDGKTVDAGRVQAEDAV